MQKLIALLFAALVMLPAGFSQQEIASSIAVEPWIPEYKARAIVEAWGVSVSYAELQYQDGMQLWNVYGTHTIGLGPAKIRLNVVVKLDARNGEFVSLEMKRADQTYDRIKVMTRMKELGVNVQSMNLVKDYVPYWEVYGYMYQNIGGYGFDMPLYIRVDVKSLQILEIRSESWYQIQPYTLPGYEVRGGAVLSTDQTKSFWSGVAEAVGIGSKQTKTVVEATADAVEVE